MRIVVIKKKYNKQDILYRMFYELEDAVEYVIEKRNTNSSYYYDFYKMNPDHLTIKPVVFLGSLKPENIKLI